MEWIGECCRCRCRCWCWVAWWETDNQGCRYCDPSQAHRNVWGHCSYTVVFQLDPAATLACVVDNDHAGQGSGCAVEHIHHDPDQAACFAIP